MSRSEVEPGVSKGVESGPWFDWTEHTLGDSGRVCTRCGQKIIDGGRMMMPGLIWVSVSGCPRIYRTAEPQGSGRPSDPDDRITLCVFRGHC